MYIQLGMARVWRGAIPTLRRFLLVKVVRCILCLGDSMNLSLKFLLPEPPVKCPDEGDEDLARLRKAAADADRGEGKSLRGLSREERRKVMLGL
jgi:hypothetical protein